MNTRPAVQKTREVLSPCFHIQPEALFYYGNISTFFRSYVMLMRARRISRAARSSGAGSMAASGEKKI
jgi:hypothetical protein